ncbi:MAG TPA: thrombospondin type 3 repeat-containing protein [Candidatus Saccharimonadaceae bacterium]|nr:thrombospondin type 3 repeat-containing protein [Candidatus Saccharimonadaceae bacterium]
MRARLRFAVLAAAALTLARAASAEPIGSYYTLTPFGGYTIYDGDLLFPGTLPLRDDLYAGGRVGWHDRHGFGLEAAGGFMPTREDVVGGRDVDFKHLSGNLMLTPFQGRYGGPFLFGGFGYGGLTPSNGGTKLKYGTVELGGGVRFWLTDAVGLRLEARNISLMQKEPKVDFLFNNIVFGGGIELALGATPRDTDGDGVPDRKDKCPDTPKGAAVDATGCPHDSDGDGVLDGLDKCPNTPKGATVDATGCPHDQDGDGVFDGLDKCADTPKGATVDATGCPHDTDGDGVLDGLDKCADTPKGATVDATGCPTDSDGDGVWDGLDKCPNTPKDAKVDKDGCPIEVTEKETELLDTGMIRLQNVNFETGKADLLPDAFPTLDIVGQVLTKWPELQVEIGGHTDSRGTAAKNQKLSEARASSVLTYIVQKFPNLKATQFTVKGYGLTRPIAPNTDELGRAKNRRVEFVVLNKDVLRREVERRRLLNKTEVSAPDTTKGLAAPALPDTTKSLATPAAPDTTKK